MKHTQCHFSVSCLVRYAHLLGCARCNLRLMHYCVDGRERASFVSRLFLSPLQADTHLGFSLRAQQLPIPWRRRREYQVVNKYPAFVIGKSSQVSGTFLCFTLFLPRGVSLSLPLPFSPSTSISLPLLLCLPLSV